MSERKLRRFTEDDRYGLWRAGDLADDLGWESTHPDAPRIRALRLHSTGEVVTTARWRRVTEPVTKDHEEKP